MTIRNLVSAAGCLGALAAAGYGAVANSQNAPTFGGEEDRAYADTLWDALVEASLAGDNAVKTVPYEGTEPHGAILETLYRELAVDGHTGLAIVKRNYGPAGVSVDEVKSNRAEHLGAVTVMFQREEGFDPDNNNWFWVKYLPDGSLDQTPQGAQMAGRVAGCIGCHQEAEGGDYLYTFDRPQ